MSAIRRPRANFRGVFTTNVPTANNDKTAETLDESRVRVGNPLNKSPDQVYREWMMQTYTANGQTLLNSYFNYFGDSGLSFAARNMPYPDTIIMSSVLSGGQTYVYQKSPDTFLGGRVELWGDLFFDSPGSAKMVDLDPVGIYGTQIFSGEVKVVNPSTGDGMLCAKNPTRAFIRDMYLDRNITPLSKTLPPGAWLGGAVWQIGLPLDGLTFDPDYLPKSPTLRALKKAAEAGQGLLMRFAMYYTVDGLDAATLAEEFKDSGYKDAIINPATGMLVGSFGAWEPGELASFPIGRMLYPKMDIPRPSSTPAFHVDMRGASTMITAGSAPPATPTIYHLAPAAILVDQKEKTVILDLLTTIPEETIVSTPPSTTDLQKPNYGDLTLTIMLSDGQEPMPVATIPYEQYNRLAYERLSGIVEVPYTAELAAALLDPNRVFCLYGNPSSPQPQPPQLLMQEIDYPYVFTNDQCLYLHEGETITYEIQVFYKGQPVRNQVIPITTSEYHFVITPGTPPPPPPPPPSPPPQLPPVRTFVPVDNTPGNAYIVSIPPKQVTSPVEATNPTVSYKTDANGKITLQVTGISPGAGMVRYQASGDTFDPNPSGALGSPNYPYFGFTSYNAFRVLPNDNYDSIPDDKITYELVYKEVIRYFYLLYPGMFARLAFQNENVARKSASLIAQMVDKSTWHSTSYMPVSRDLSDGKRKLLQRWCALNE
jgi:hypothetical protein